MSDDDDWFEQARQEMDEEPPEAESAEGPADSDAAEDAEKQAPDEGSESEGTAPEPDADGEVDESGAEESTEGTPGESADESRPDAASFEEAFQEAGDGAAGDVGGDVLESGDSAGFDVGGDQDLDVGGGGGFDMGGDLGDGGDQDFGFGDVGGEGAGGEEFGFGDIGGAPEEFDEAELDSDIDRVDIGIDGLDEMILGGVPQRSLMVTIGSAGTGKTTFALQFLDEALADGGRAVYITLEESREAILSTAEEKGWPFREYEANDQLAVVALDPIEMANSLASIRNDLSRLVGEFGADRLVLDSVSLLEMMYDHPAKRRSEVFDFARSLKDAGVTTMLTSEASEDNPYTSRYGIVEYLVDAVFILQYVRPSDFRETRLAVEIQKIRDANHSRETKPYEITNDGISVYRQANIF